MSDELLDGPRGRRLCLELAGDAEPNIRAALSDLAYEADIAAGATVMRRGLCDDRSGVETAGARDAEPTAADLAEQLRALPSLTVDASMLDEALRRSVDAARSWQAPEGTDLVAADPQVRAALVGIAAQVSGHPASAWWIRERTDRQWAVEFDPVGDLSPFVLPTDAAVRWSIAAREEEQRARAERPSDPTANVTGSWWSHPWGAPHTTGPLASGVPAGIPLVEDGHGWTHAGAIPVAGSGLTYEIRSGDDWADLCRRYPLEVTASRRHDWYRTTGRAGRWLLPDWGRVAGEWDAVHLTAWAYLTAATRAIAIDAEYASVIGGWGPDETYWLTGRVRPGPGLRVDWVADAPEGPWRRA